MNDRITQGLLGIIALALVGLLVRAWLPPTDVRAVPGENGALYLVRGNRIYLYSGAPQPTPDGNSLRMTYLHQGSADLRHLGRDFSLDGSMRFGLGPEYDHAAAQMHSAIRSEFQKDLTKTPDLPSLPSPAGGK